MTVPEALQIALQHHQGGRFAEAEALYRQILAVDARHADALHLLGLIAHQVGRNDVAVDVIRQAIAVDGGRPEFHSNLGAALIAAGQAGDAVAAFGRAIELKPDFVEAHWNLGDALASLGRFEEAVAAHRRAIVLRPDFPEAHWSLGRALGFQGRLEESISAYQRAVELRPGYAEALNNLGNALRACGRNAEATAAYRRAVASAPGNAEAHNNLGVALRSEEKPQEAIAAFRRASELKPDLAAPWANLGDVLRDCGRPDEAIAAYQRASQLEPDHAETLGHLAVALKDAGRLDEAIACHRRALHLAPGDATTLSNLIYTLHFHPASTAASLDGERRRWERQFGAPWAGALPPHPNDRDPERRLRIGYVSPDLRDHVIGRNVLPLFEHRDRAGFEIVCYSGVVREDDVTARFRGHADLWRSTVGVADGALAGMIRRDGVDILVDLSQHLGGNRLPVFARRPAPVQVSFAAYPDGTGLEAIGHRISDRHLEVGAEDGRERLHFLDSFWCYESCATDLAVTALPALAAGRVTFGCLNNFCKVNDAVLRLWARVLVRVKESRLVILSPEGNHRQHALGVLAAAGVAAHRVEFVAPLPWRGYLGQYYRLDLMLDTFPYNGHTTSLDALWMGVPVVTLAGAGPVSRAGLSQLTNLGLPEWVARSDEEFVDIAARGAADLDGLAGLRVSLRARMRASVLLDGVKFARQFEQACRGMWREWCGESQPAP